MKILWWIRKAEILSVSVRKKIRATPAEEDAFYAVINLKNKFNGKEVPFACICFQDAIWEPLSDLILHPEKRPFIFSFQGEVNVKYGNTYFSILECFDSLGLPYPPVRHEVEDDDLPY